MAQPTTEFLLSRPLLPEADQSHLQRVLTTVVMAIEQMEKKIGAIESHMKDLGDGSDNLGSELSLVKHQTTKIEKLFEDLKGEQELLQPLKWDIQELKTNGNFQNEKMREMEDRIKGLGEQSRLYHENKLRIDGLHRDAEARTRSVNDALSDLASRVDAKVDEESLSKAIAGAEESAKRQGIELDALKRTIDHYDTTIRTLNTDVEQLHLTNQSRERQFNEHIQQLESAIDTAIKKAQGANTAAIKSDLDTMRNDMQSNNRKIQDTFEKMYEKIERTTDTSTKLSNRISDLSASVDGQANRLTDVCKKIDADIRVIHNMMEKMDPVSKPTFNKFREEMDHRFLELLNAIQGVEHGKIVLERQIAEAGRILCQSFSGNGGVVPSDSPLRSLRGGSKPTPPVPEPQGSRQHTLPHPVASNDNAVGSPPDLHYKSSPLNQGALCSCDDDIF
eukprot:TRINITY_DN25299_c0_g1_i1.p1 TRINITY_DN25299_c0_g1~~TRINITY_DN25299_c0_g1_i1.p1  ORF type:complete len:448 (+),score=102.51 TRINITY_DN25299_c0_g1_i1:89-1432(+)